MKKFFVFIIFVLLLTLPLYSSFAFADSNSSVLNFTGSSLSILDYAVGFYNNTSFRVSDFAYLDFHFTLNDSFSFKPYLRYFNSYTQSFDPLTNYYVQLPGSYNVTSFLYGEPILIDGNYPTRAFVSQNGFSRDVINNGTSTNTYYYARFFYYHNDLSPNETSIDSVTLSCVDLSGLPRAITDEDLPIYFDTNSFWLFDFGAFASAVKYVLYDYLSSAGNHLYIVFPTNLNNSMNTRTYYFSPPGSSYDAGYQDGYNNGLDIGYARGFASGGSSVYPVAFSEGEAQGYNNGYQQGLSDSGNYTFSSLLFAVFDVPITVLRSLFNYDFLGFNLLGLVTGFFTFAVVLWFLRRMMK